MFTAEELIAELGLRETVVVRVARLYLVMRKRIRSITMAVVIVWFATLVVSPAASLFLMMGVVGLFALGTLFSAIFARGMVVAKLINEQESTPLSYNRAFYIAEAIVIFSQVALIASIGSVVGSSSPLIVLLPVVFCCPFLIFPLLRRRLRYTGERVGGELCLWCGYDLRGQAHSGTCPECGGRYLIDVCRHAWLDVELRKKWL